MYWEKSKTSLYEITEQNTKLWRRETNSKIPVVISDFLFTRSPWYCQCQVKRVLEEVENKSLRDNWAEHQALTSRNQLQDPGCD